MTEPKKTLTIYDALDKKKVQEAIDNLIKGHTPAEFIKERPGRGGKTFNYVETYYVVDQLNKLFGFRWNFEIISEEITDKEATVKGRLTAHASDGQTIVKEQFGEADRQAGVPPGDTKKGAASDCLKKCASLFGIALDVYWGKELEIFTPEQESGEVQMNTNDAVKAFNKYVTSKKLAWSKVFELLGISSLSEIADYQEAYRNLKEKLDGQVDKS